MPRVGKPIGKYTVRDELNLTPQERRCVELLYLGKSNKQIAEAMGLSLKTVTNYIHQAYVRCKVTSRRGMTLLLARHKGTIPPGDMK